MEVFKIQQFILFTTPYLAEIMNLPFLLILWIAHEMQIQTYKV